MPLAEDLRLTIDARLSAYHVAAGVGADAYCSEPMAHPMADGKFLQVLAVLRRTRLLSAAQSEQWATQACVRLQASAVPFGTEGCCWGLGFSWRDLPASEPFLITSAVVTRGALECRREGLGADAVQQLAARGARGLRNWVQDLALTVDQGSVALPLYSPGIPEPIYNAAAYAYGALALAQEPSAAEVCDRAALDWIGARRVSGAGWPYSPSNGVIDLLHQCYLLNAMAEIFGTPSIETASAEMVGQFAAPCCFADAMRLIPSGEMVAEARDIAWLRPLGEAHLELLPKPARLWSLGELLVLLSRLGREGRQKEGWTRLGRRVAEAILLRLTATAEVEAGYPGQTMHALHGLACYLALLRGQAQSKAAVPDGTTR